MIGAEPDFSLWMDYCRIHPEDDVYCVPGVTFPHITRPGWSLPPKDTRIKAAVVMAPVSFLFTRSSLANISIPLRVYRAADDEVVKNAWQADYLLSCLTNKPEQITVSGGHYIFLAPCPDKLAIEQPFLCNDRDGIDRRTIHRQIGKELVDFFSRTVNN
jgi:predicted dienelactone hydrolase